MRQMDSLGSTAVRKLSAAGISSIEALAATDASQIDAILSRDPPYGQNLLRELREFPKLTLTATLKTQVGRIQLMPQRTRETEFVTVCHAK
jgi:ATP-dependent DNA helicase HFM1/MER3